jgi:hypothetical protein
MAVKPIRPDEVVALKATLIPDEVIEAFNELIAENMSGGSSSFTQDKVVTRILSKMPDTSRDALYDNHWLDVEDVYRAEGWKVEYDKPGYCETYSASFAFSRKK